MEETKLESAAFLMVDAYHKNAKMVDALNYVASKESCKGVPYNVLQGMWLVLDAYYETKK